MIMSYVPSYNSAWPGTDQKLIRIRIPATRGRLPWSTWPPDTRTNWSSFNKLQDNQKGATHFYSNGSYLKPPYPDFLAGSPVATFELKADPLTSFLAHQKQEC